MNIKYLLITIFLGLSFKAYSDPIRRHGWHGGNIRRFELHDRALWAGGHWRHARYGGHLGWYWVVGPSWYLYSQPIYPYPDPYRPPVVILENQPQTNPTPPPPPQNWYYCEEAKDYYPYVSNCPSGWKTIPVSPPPPKN